MALGKIFDNIKEKLKKEGEVIKGNESKDKYYSSNKTYPDDAMAAAYFKEAKAKLFDVNAWTHIESLATATFELYDAMGKPSGAEKVSIGDYIKILLPGPLPENWVRVKAIQETDTFAEFVVRPSENPTNVEAETEHFFSEEATSTFNVERRGKEIIAREIGKDEYINNQEDVPAGRAIVNTVVAQGGWAGFQRYQWESLTEYLVDDEIKRTRE